MPIISAPPNGDKRERERPWTSYIQKHVMIGKHINGEYTHHPHVQQMTKDIIIHIFLDFAGIQYNMPNSISHD